MKRNFILYGILPIPGEGNVILIPRDVSIDVNRVYEEERRFSQPRKKVNKIAQSLKINETEAVAASLTDTRMVISNMIKY